MNTTVPNNKIAGDSFTADESNNMVNAINSKQDELPIVFKAYSSYAAMIAFTDSVGTTSTIYNITVPTDETDGGAFNVYNYYNGEISSPVQQNIV